MLIQVIVQWLETVLLLSESSFYPPPTALQVLKQAACFGFVLPDFRRAD